MKNPVKSYALVGIQVFLMAYLLLSAPIFASNPVLLTVEFIGVFIGAWGIWEMRQGFNAIPDVKAGNTLVTTGIYGYIRNPMYSALLIVYSALVIDNFSTMRLFGLIFLAIVLIMKIRYEEELLDKHFKEYLEYKKKTRRLIPFLY